MANMFGRKIETENEFNEGTGVFRIAILHQSDGAPVYRLDGPENPRGLTAETEIEAKSMVEKSGHTWTGMDD